MITVIEKKREKEKLDAFCLERRLVIMASLRVYRFKMNALFWTISFCRRQERKEKKGDKNLNLKFVKTHVEATRISMVESCGMKRSRFLLGTFHRFSFI